MRDSAANSAAGVRKPTMEETALGGRRTMPRDRAKSRRNNLQTINRVVYGDLMFDGTCTFKGLAVVKIPHHTI
jgi:hypothetical protein